MKLNYLRGHCQRRSAVTITGRQRGFTLLEIMVVVVIIGIMATFVLPKVLSRPYDAQRAKALTDMKSLRTALELYQLDNFDLPTIDQGLQALVTAPRADMRKYPKGGYVDALKIHGATHMSIVVRVSTASTTSSAMDVTASWVAKNKTATSVTG